MIKLFVACHVWAEAGRKVLVPFRATGADHVLVWPQSGDEDPWLSAPQAALLCEVAPQRRIIHLRAMRGRDWSGVDVVIEGWSRTSLMAEGFHHPIFEPGGPEFPRVVGAAPAACWIRRHVCEELPPAFGAGPTLPLVDAAPAFIALLGGRR